MGETNARETGVLEVSVEYGSMFLGSTVPIEVRDAGQRVVGTGAGSWRHSLPPGLYSVETLNATGARLREIVQVLPGETSEVVLGAAPEPPSTGATRGAVPPAPLPPWLARPTASGSAAEPPPQAGGVQLLEVTHCTLQPDAAGWVCLPVPNPPQVPTARFRVGDEDWLLSLPLNPTAPDPALSSCRVDILEAGPRTRLQVCFSPQRRVTSFVDGLRRSRSFEKAGPLVAEASDLLLGKYQDPAGAALGGLTLQRLGALSGLRGWTENLAHSFGWIPDAGILLASILVEDESECSRGLDLLLTASRHRPMYTDGLSLAVDLLRRWSAEADKPGERKAAMERLADLSAWADWDSVNLTTVTREYP